jgi:diaminohydroxyphosphoribosylaminopyrimidine deaminase / 5-amino-6-(5-phosphoribosylamino)uracil reductase
LVCSLWTMGYGKNGALVLHRPQTIAHRPLLTMTSDRDLQHIERALELAARGQGSVEPNPMVGSVIAHDDEVVSEGWHQRFGGPHAEVHALVQAGEAARRATLYVTLEPCCHQGKTPPCTKAIIAAGIARVVLALRDPFPKVAGGGIAELVAAGIQVECGVGEEAARRLCAPYLKLVTKGRPWVIAKWAMTLDGRIATSSGESQWISGEESRRVVHQLRGRVDAIVVGSQTLMADNPLLTARTAGLRTPTRIILDSQARTPISAQVVRTASEAPTLIVVAQAAVAEHATAQRAAALAAAGCEVYFAVGDTPGARLAELLDELGRRRMTNILVEGGGQLLGSLRDLDEIDEVHAFIAPKLLGQAGALSPFAGQGAASLNLATRLHEVRIEQLGDDAYISGRVHRSHATGE